MEASSSNRSSTSESMGALANQRLRLENPFTLKVGQVFTGFGVGCGVGIGVGRPINLGAVPVLNQVMSATRGATDAFSGISSHVNNSMRKLGAKNIEAGIGCGVGFGHGFGIGVAIRPSVLNQVQACVMQTMGKTMIKLGMKPNVEMEMGETGMSSNERSGKIAVESRKQIDVNAGGYGSSSDSSVSSRGSVNETPLALGTGTEKVISSFLQNPVVKGGGGDGEVQAEKSMVGMVMKHQELIEKLMEENRKLRGILMDDLKIPAAKLGDRFSDATNLSCSDCFECRRKHRKPKH